MLIHGQNLFPLTKTHVRAVGYYMDQDGEIWSTRARAGRLTKLKGSRTSSGRYITLQTNGSFGQIHRLSDLQHAARAHSDFITETTVGALPRSVIKIDLASALGLRGNATQQRGMHGMPQGLKAPAKSGIPACTPVQEFLGAKSATSVERHHAANATEGIQKRGWVIALVSGDTMVFSLKPAIHTTLVSVNDEMKRLATLQPGKKFVKLRIEGALTVGASTWE